MNTHNIPIPKVVGVGGGLSGISSPPQSADLPIPLDQLLQQATLLAQQLQRERSALKGGSGTNGRSGVKALEQQVVQVWKAIRAARSPGRADIVVVRRRYKWD
jgi:hypothetical protein